MTDFSKTLQIKSILNGGSVNAGHGVFFEFLLADGTTTSFYCDADLLAKLMGNLRQYGSMADAVRAKIKAGAMDIAAPYQIERVSNSALSADRKLVMLEVFVTEGFPVSLTMTRAHAEKTIEFLQRELLRQSQPQDPRKTN